MFRLKFAVLIALFSLLSGFSVSAQHTHGGQPGEAAYQVHITTEPEIIQANQAFRLRVHILNADESPVSEFDEVHTKLLHLIVVSEDLTQFFHLHPDYQGDGEFVLENALLPEAADYILFADFTPTGGEQQAVRGTLSTEDAETRAPELRVSATDVIVNDLQFQLEVPAFLDAGVQHTLKFHVTDAQSGVEVNDLDEYLGAGGHLVILNDLADTYIHTHPAGHDMEAMAGMTMTFGPDLEFETSFPGMGLYAMWLQVQYKGDVYTAPFVVRVSDLAEIQPEATAEGHNHG